MLPLQGIHFGTSFALASNNIWRAFSEGIIMNALNMVFNLKKRPFAFGLSIFGMLVFATIVFGHGGKHAPDEFTPLLALKKATGLYDQLLAKGKLDQTWERGLMQVEISKRRNQGKEEIAVSFQRIEGDPKSVFIFFTADGKYSGSNFTGE